MARAFRIRFSGLALLAVLLFGMTDLCSFAEEARSTEHFEKHVRPLLVEHCIKCHGLEKQSGGLRLDQGAAALAGGDSGPVIRSGKPEESLLMEAVRQTGDLKMPPKSKLSDAQISSLEKWIKEIGRAHV